MKIGVDANSLTRNFRDGTRRYTEELFNALAKIDKKNKYIFFASKKVNIPKQKNFRLVIIPGYPFLKRQLYLPMYAAKQKIDVFHHMDPYGAVLLANKKSVVTVHDVKLEKTYPIFRSLKYFIKRYYSEFARFLILKNSKVILVDSKSTMDDMNILFKNLLNNKTIDLVPLAPSPFFKSTKTNSMNKDYFLCMGDFTPRKNIETIFKSYSSLNKMYKNKCKLILIVSTKKESSRFERMSMSYGLKKELRIITSPSDNTVRSLYQNAMCFIYPSLYEGFGFPILEAMACGCPVITTNYGSTKEVAGTAAILIDPLNTEQIKKQMIRIIETPKLRQKLKTDGLKQVKKFSWTETARKTLNAYSYI